MIGVVIGKTVETTFSQAQRAHGQVHSVLYLRASPLIYTTLT